MYTAYVLTDKSREHLLEKFPPKYSKIIGHHVTVEFGVPEDTLPPDPAVVKVLGIADSGDGLEALVVTVNGSRKRDAGSFYHITWSLDPEKYKPKDSNDLVKGASRYKISLPITIETIPQVLSRTLPPICFLIQRLRPLHSAN